MKIRFSAMIMSVIFLLVLTSCSGAKQLNERLIIQGLGIDYKNEQYIVNIMYMDTSSEKKETKTVKTTGISVLDAMTNSISITGKEPLYSQNLFIILGGNLIKKGYKDAIDFFSQYYESRQNVNIFTTLKNAEDIIMLKKITPQQINDISDDTKRSGRSIISSLMQMENDRLSGYNSPKTTNIVIKDGVVKSSGTNVFIKDKYKYTISSENSLGALLVSGKADTATQLVVENNINDFTLSNCSSKIDVLINDKDTIFNIDISAKADVYKLHLEEEDIKKSIEKRIESICEKVIKKCIEEKKTDIFGFSDILINKNKSLYNNMKNINEILSKSKYKISVDVSIN